MLERLKKVVRPYWTKIEMFRFTAMVAFFVLVISIVFLWGYSYIIFIFPSYYNLIYVIILTILAVTAYKKGYARQFSAKQRKLILIASFVLGASIILLALLKQFGCY
jgi:hypothetical protein